MYKGTFIKYIFTVLVCIWINFRYHDYQALGQVNAEKNLD